MLLLHLKTPMNFSYWFLLILNLFLFQWHLILLRYAIWPRRHPQTQVHSRSARSCRSRWTRRPHGETMTSTSMPTATHIPIHLSPRNFRRTVPGGDLHTESGQTLQGSFSAVSKPIHPLSSHRKMEGRFGANWRFSMQKIEFGWPFYIKRFRAARAAFIIS